MVTVCRVDERLLHGQVAVTWVSQIAPDAIVIANDEVVENEVAKLALKMAKPEGVKMAIRRIDEAVNLISRPETKEMRILLLVREVKDARRIVERCDEIHYLNIGGVKPQAGVVRLTPRIALNEENLEDLRVICKKVEKVLFQIVPSEEAKDIKKILKKTENRRERA